MRFIQQLIVLALSLFLLPVSHAAVERIIDYEYDGAGNIVRIISQEQSELPVVSPITPAFINIGRTVTVTATGSNLLGIDITSDIPELSVKAISSTSTSLSFELTASDQAPIGDAIIRFITGIGEIQQTIFVAESPPTLSTDPSPIAIEDNGAVTNVSLVFSEPRPEDETYALTMVDTGIANVSSGSFTILAGQTQANIILTGVSAGTTYLEVELAGKFYAYSFAVYVGETYLQLSETFPDMLTRNLFTNSIGILKNTRGGAQSYPVGVVVGSSDVLFSSLVGVTVDSSVGLFSPAVGILVDDISNLAFSSTVGALLGAISENISPLTTGLSTSVDFEITGVNLGEVVTVSIAPSVDIVVGTFSVNSEGTVLTIPVAISSGAALGPYQITLQDALGSVEIRSGMPLQFDIN